MDRDALLRLLDLEGKDPTPAAGDLAITTHNLDPPPSELASPTALDLDDWALRRGQEIRAESERVRTLDLDDAAVADFFGAAFEPEPRLQPACRDPRRHAFVQQLLQTPEYRALHAGTSLQDTAASIAAIAFAEQFAASRKEKTGGSDPMDREIATLRAVGQALVRASAEVEEAREAAAALGMSPGSPGSNDARAIAALYRRVRSSPRLQRICELAGRYRRVAQSRQRRKLAHGVDDLIGVTLDGDVGRALPHELARLAMPECEDDVLRRLVERQVMCREYRASEPVARGPIIVSIDESGSMEGDKVHTAKALALAMAWIARLQRRWIALIAYSGDSGERTLALPPSRWNQGALLDWLEAFIGRGSSLDVPVREMPQYYERLRAPAGITDVLFVTDAICHIPATDRDRFNAWKARVRARLITLVIESAPGDLTGISDEVHQVATLDASETAVERVLSL